MNDEFGYIRWAKLTVYKGGANDVVKPRITMDILAGKTPQGLYRLIRVGFEAPAGKYNTLTPEGVKDVAVDPDAFVGLTDSMIRTDGPTEFFKVNEDGKSVAADFDSATRATQRLRIGARVKLEGLGDNLRQAQRRIAKGKYDPIPNVPCKVRFGDEEFPGIRESYTLVREGKIELAPLGSFRASNDNVLVLS